MKKLIWLAPLLALGCGGQPGTPQVPKLVPVINIVAAPDPGGLFNVYRGPACTELTKVASTPLPTFADVQAPSGTNCYAVRSQVNGIESDLSNTVMVTVP